VCPQPIYHALSRAFLRASGEGIEDSTPVPSGQAARNET